MRYLLICLAFLIIIAGCDNRKDYFKDINKTPELKIRKGGTTVYAKNLKDSMKFRNEYYLLDYQIIDEQTDLSPSLFYRLNVLQETINLDQKTIKLYPENTGLMKAVYAVSDNYITAYDTIEITVFANLPPVAGFEVTNTQIHDPLECNINAALSYDKDAAHGGTIINYEYKINTFTITSTDNNINYIFPQQGNYNIKVRVQDDDNTWSEYKSIIYTLQ